MLLNIYPGSLVFSWSTIILGSQAIKNRLKREGYVEIKKKRTFVEIFFRIMQTTIKGSIPVLNLIMAGSMIFMTDNSYGSFKQQLIKNGDIVYNPTQKTEANKQENDTDSKHFNSEEPSKHITTEEKLAFIQSENEKLDLYLKNKEKIDAYYAYWVQVEVEKQILSQMPSIDIDNLSLEELQNILVQVQSSQPLEEIQSQKTHH